MYNITCPTKFKCNASSGGKDSIYMYAKSKYAGKLHDDLLMSCDAIFSNVLRNKHLTSP